MLELIFYGSISLILFAYLGYPISLMLMSLFVNLSVKKEPYFPSITFIITAYNEENSIREKLLNTLALEYPREKLQVIVASDGSQDKTNSIVAEFLDRGIELLEVKKRGGKENAQKEAVQIAQGEVLAFSDVATRLDPQGLSRIAENFADLAVGCVSSVDRIIGRDGELCGEGFYVRYEMWLRKLESRVNSLVGVSGSFFAARKEVCQDFASDMQSDFRTVLNSIRLGLRAVSDPDAVGYYQDVSDSKKEFDRKVRTVLRGLTVFFKNPEFLNLSCYGFFSYQYFCHKLLRWLVPVFLLVSLLVNVELALDSKFFLGVLSFHLSFYGVALWGYFKVETLPSGLLKIPMYFLTVNCAILVAWFRYLKGTRMVIWTPSER